MFTGCIARSFKGVYALRCPCKEKRHHLTSDSLFIAMEVQTTIAQVEKDTACGSSPALPVSLRAIEAQPHSPGSGTFDMDLRRAYARERALSYHRSQSFNVVVPAHVQESGQPGIWWTSNFSDVL